MHEVFDEFQIFRSIKRIHPSFINTEHSNLPDVMQLLQRGSRINVRFPDEEMCGLLFGPQSGHNNEVVVRMNGESGWRSHPKSPTSTIQVFYVS